MEPEQTHTSTQTHGTRSQLEDNPESELARILARFARDSYETRELTWYAIALLMEDEEQAWRTGAQESGGCRWLYFRTIQGDEFPLPDPGLTAEMENKLAAAVHALNK